jgi:hypothetical protein
MWLLSKEPFNIPPAMVARMSIDQIKLTLRDKDEVNEEMNQLPTISQDEVAKLWRVYNRVPEWYAEKLKHGQ